MSAGPPLPHGVLRPDFVFMDVEASGLQDGSFPIEFGWSDDGLNWKSFLIRPHADWSERDWSEESYRIHGVQWADLERFGVAPQEACRRIVEVFERAGGVESARMWSDAPRWDMSWIDRLFSAVGERCPFRADDQLAAVFEHDEMVEGEWNLLNDAAGLIEGVFARPHRAGPDARHSAAAFRLAVDASYRAAVGAWKADGAAASRAPSR